MRSIGTALLILTAVLLVGLDILAQEYFWYWTYWWFDLVMHFFGGGVIAGLGGYILYSIHTIEVSAKDIAWATVGFGIVIGIVWELFEYEVGAFPPEGYLLDTTFDLVMDILGALLVFAFMRYVHEKSRNISLR